MNHFAIYPKLTQYCKSTVFQFLKNDFVFTFSRVRLFVTPWTAAHQAPLSMRFSRQGYWSGLHCPPPGHLPNPGTEPASLMSSALADVFFTTRVTWEVTLKRKYKLS